MEEVKTPGDLPEEEFDTLSAAAKKWRVTKGNIKYFVTRHKVPSKKVRMDVIVNREILLVHMPSLKRAKDGRLFKGEKSK